MTDTRQQLLDWIEADRAMLIEFFAGFVRAKSPNPPGDTGEAVAHIRRFLDARALPYRIIDPEPRFPNVVGTFEGGAGAGRHLVLNGHIDVFPVGEETWTHGPWSGAVADGKVWGRGACDMKCGTSASIFTYAYLHRVRDRLKGRLTLTAVSDEETFGPFGARYLMEHHPEVHGDCCLNGEPSSPYTIRFGEKAPIWLAVTVTTRGSHGAYTHTSASATKIAAKLIGELEALTDIPVEAPHNVASALTAAREAIDKAQGAGAADIIQKVTVNIGRIEGGLKVNMVPGHCRFEVDIRLPVGATKERIMAAVRAIVGCFPEAKVEEINSQLPSWCDPYGDMVGILQDNVEALRGFRPTPIVSLGGTDARLWRLANVPAYVYGPKPTNMGAADEHVEIDEFLHVVRTHVLSAHDYLTR
ncbi:MAG: M20 family metallopeptidase [Alphaproteobacteria bacterium]|nr:M20 family metallopeptidase [Alphaproteobacteria bacterium]